ncbi:MAG: 4-hydroxy-tetrahydrodipicolinate reductase [Candidatus Hadarchaeota archaeon]
MIRVALCGACGRMGKMIIRQISKQGDMKLVAAVDAPENPNVEADAGELAGVGKLGVKVAGAEKLAETLKQSKPDVLVDFTSAAAALENVRAAAEAGVAVVVGTTGFAEEQRQEIEKAVKKGKIKAVVSPNMSVGVNVFFKLVGEAAKRLGSDYKAEIVEVHHAHKKDAPSGTAKVAAQVIAKELGCRTDEIKIKSIREGEVVGDHTVTFSGPFELVEITHKAKSRETFAAGVVMAARYIAEKGRPGVVEDMRDVLGL